MIIKLENITKTYSNESQEIEQAVLKDLNFSVSKGDLVSIIGPSGSGKSTMLNLMGILDKPTSGKVMFNETDISDFSDNQLAELRSKKIGFVFQQHHLLPQLSLLENVLLPLMTEKDKNKKEAAAQRAKELIEMVGLQGKENQLPSQLSVGECQRTAVVRALINNPELILADEPTGSLDEESAINMVNLLSEINTKQNLAVVMVTHSKELALKMKTTYKLHGGKLEQL
ncbi:MAG: ABC transporter ATP-binding protein [Salinivirgaceae bacterium]|jgi:lipoprotein-releasing system ATP-binding protein|nr:ABC transporter ATP-binding protein [Salinivirgaceae bacterium]